MTLIFIVPGSRWEFINNVYCSGLQSCLNVTNFHVYDKVYDHNHQILNQTSISIISLGSKSINRSIINDVRTAHCILFENCEYTRLVWN